MIWGRGGARSRDTADTSLFKKSEGMGEMSLFFIVLN